MSGGTVCICTSPIKTINWEVVARKCNYSKFNGSRHTPSRYSEVRCSKCLCRWRTTARYVDTLPDYTGVRDD